MWWGKGRCVVQRCLWTWHSYRTCGLSAVEVEICQHSSRQHKLNEREESWDGGLRIHCTYETVKE